VNKARIIGWMIATVVRCVGLTLRFSLEDRAGITKENPEHPMLWVFWHNRLFTLPLVYRRYMSQRTGDVLTSASKDGEILADAIGRFGCGTVRGSSSRRGALALLELVDTVREGGDVAITPDGPRGPRCRLQPGIIKLAQKTGAPILAVKLRYHRVWELKTWDRFKIPYPFSRVDVVFQELQMIEDRPGDDFLESERLRIERLLLTEGDIAEGEEEENNNKK
jgi:lysophospholipid acyltransferase (LPLAT)-like uncharacterized protein